MSESTTEILKFHMVYFDVTAVPSLFYQPNGKNNKMSNET